MTEFTIPRPPEFEKIARLNREVIVTEKIDGTCTQVNIRWAEGSEYEEGYDTRIGVGGLSAYIRAGSRNRWVLYLGSDDHYGFGRWVHANAHGLAILGLGTHFGEWWGQGIERKYGLAEKRWSLFNVARWYSRTIPACCRVVPLLRRGIGFGVVYEAIDELKEFGSFAAPGFMKPEGVVAYHTHGGHLFKMTIEKDEEHKFQSTKGRS